MYFFDAFTSDRSDLLSTGYTMGSGSFWARNLSTYAPLINLVRKSVHLAGGSTVLSQLLCNSRSARPPLHISSTTRMIRCNFLMLSGPDLGLVGLVLISVIEHKECSFQFPI